jgi:membrane protein implicated in regulation of membrane protease activity
MKYISYTSSKPPTLLRKTVAIIATAALVTVGLMFSAMLLVVLLAIGAVAFAYVWWRTREVRKQMRQMQEQMQGVRQPGEGSEKEVIVGEVIEGEVIEGEVIEGEVIRRDDSRDDLNR